MKRKQQIKEIALSARIDTRIKAMADKFCKSRGLVMARFVEEAILDKLEESQDVADISKLRRESVRPFDDVLRELELTD